MRTSLLQGIKGSEPVADRHSAPATPCAGPALRPLARVYVAAVIVIGSLMLADSASYLLAGWPAPQWILLAGLTLASGAAVLKIPGVPANFSISDVFTLTTAVVFGPRAATLIVAIDSLTISARLVRSGLPIERILFNAAAPPASMWICAHLFYLTSGLAPLHRSLAGLEAVGPWLLLFAAAYFLVNTVTIAVAIGLHERAPILQIWRAHFQNLWVTFIGGGLGAACVVFALQLGTYGQVMLALPVVLAAILHFAYRNATGRVADQLRHLAEVNRLHLSTIEALAHAIDAKDAVTHGHIRRVQAWAVELAARLGIADDREIRAIEAAALLHDIGKLAIPEHILNKPGRLTPVEFERMKSHARVGAEILSEIDFPYPVVPIVRHHHENWDGTGYPDGISGEAIPIGARILSVVDCFDALTSDRPYRRALPAGEAMAIIDARTGTMYDPAIVAAFKEICTSSAPAEATAVAATAPAEATAQSASTAAAGTSDLQLALRIGAALGAVGGRQPVWCAYAEALRDGLAVDNVVVLAAAESADRLEVTCVAGRDARALEDLSIAVGDRTTGWSAATGQPMINAEAALDLFDVEVPELRSALTVPLASPQGQSWVVTLYDRRASPFTAAHAELVRTSALFALARIDAGSRAWPPARAGVR